jgi:L-threonylcarbamoyladenylate synthase
MKTVRISDPNVFNVALETLRSGGLIVVPSDTVYGLSVDATNKEAVKKLIAFKSRVPGKAISVFVGSLKRAHEYVDISDSQKQLLESILPGAYTIVLPSKHVVAVEIEAENGTLGIRVPDYDFNNTLVKKFGKPVTATSANQAGRPPHSSIESLLKSTPEQKKHLIDLIIDAGKLARKKPSTVVDFTTENFEVLRAGEVSVPMSNAKEFVSSSELETQDIAQKLLRENLNVLSQKPLVFMLYGDLGAGKTIFVKGLGKALGVNNIISPTFVITYEYDVHNDKVDMLHHFDLYRIAESEEFKHWCW